MTPAALISTLPVGVFPIAVLNWRRPPVAPLQLDSAFALGLMLVAVAGSVAIGIAAIYFEYKRERALIESGEYDPEAASRGTLSLVLAVGLLLVAYGAGSFVQALSVNAYGFRGVTPAFLGLALLVYYVVRKRGG